MKRISLDRVLEQIAPAIYETEACFDGRETKMYDYRNLQMLVDRMYWQAAWAGKDVLFFEEARNEGGVLDEIPQYPYLYLWGTGECCAELEKDGMLLQDYVFHWRLEGYHTYAELKGRMHRGNADALWCNFFVLIREGYREISPLYVLRGESGEQIVSDYMYKTGLPLFSNLDEKPLGCLRNRDFILPGLCEIGEMGTVTCLLTYAAEEVYNYLYLNLFSDFCSNGERRIVEDRIWFREREYGYRMTCEGECFALVFYDPKGREYDENRGVFIEEDTDHEERKSDRG